MRTMEARSRSTSLKAAIGIDGWHLQASKGFTISISWERIAEEESR